MKTSIWIGGAAAIALATSAGMVVAQQAQPQDPAQSTSRQDRLMARVDTNGDGRISQAEFVAGRVSRLTATDTNRDGTVTREEMMAAREVRQDQRADQHFARLDGNNDGAVTRAEYDAAREARGERREERRAERGDRGPRRGMRGPGRGHRMGGEGMRGERGERGPVVIAEVEARMAEGFAKLDANSDGYVTAEERQAARQSMRQERREHRRERRSQAAQSSE
jgi:Ca2+-binding EF-hand superfamily protein